MRLSVLTLPMLFLVASLCAVSCKKEKDVREWQIVPNALSIHPGDEVLLSVSPKSDDDVLWVVEDNAVAMITPEGLLTARKVGHTRVIAEVASKRLYCSVDVKEAPSVFPTDGRLIVLTEPDFKQKVWDYTTHPNTFVYKADKPAVINFWTAVEPESEEMLDVMEKFAKKNAGIGYVFTVDVGNTDNESPERNILKAFVALKVPYITTFLFPSFVLIRKKSPQVDGLTGATLTNVTTMQSFFDNESKK